LRNLVREQLLSFPGLPVRLRRVLQHTVLGRTADTKSLWLENFYFSFTDAEQRALLRHRQEACGAESYFQYWNREPQPSLLGRMLYADQKTYLVELLMKQDKMSMAASIESRVPFLDYKLVEFAARIPDDLKLRSEGKYVLKRAIGDLLPQEIIYRKKQGFPTPLRDWFRDPLVGLLLNRLYEANGLLAAYLDLDEVRRLVANHQSGTADNTERIWRLLTLQVWGDVFLNGESPEDWSAASTSGRSGQIV
jgi:asparagine synthase (glutamine-hydrolysing)